MPLSEATLADADFRLMVEALHDHAVLLLDPAGDIVEGNRAAQRLYGCERDGIVGQHCSRFHPPEAIKEGLLDKALQQARESGRAHVESWLSRHDATRFWGETTFTRLDGPDGTARGFAQITRDVTERRQQDELLRASEERFRLVVEGVKDYAIFMLDPEGHIVSWNLGAQHNKGYTADEIIGQHFSKFYPPEVAARGWPAEELRNALRDGRFEDEGWRVRKDGSRFWASVVITAVYDRAGRHRGFAKVTRDLTERRRITALEDEGRRMTTFLAMLGHELRNPLAPISNAVELLKREQTESRVLRMTRDIIDRQLKQMTRLIDDLLDVGRITSGKIQLEAKPVRLRDAVLDAADAVRALAAQKEQRFEVQADAADPWITGDRARIVQVVSNLLHNACKFTPVGGQVSVSLGLGAANADTGLHDAEITVRDSGMGVQPQDMQRIFDLFVQGEQDVARSSGGLGLGLSLVQQLVALHGGRVSVFSSGRPGEGSEFVVQLPAAAVPQPGGATARSAGDSLVLVVDDNKDAAETLSLLVQALGYDTRVVHGGVAALEAAKELRPDVMLIDIGMPDLDGHAVVRRLRAEVVDPPLAIAVTGYGQASDRETSYEAGFHSHLTKPVDVDRLADILAHLLRPVVATDRATGS
ncbi:PAS domain S-box protein [uncultured Variovorax sp.]|uniref:PAS domain-containing hybrid sensor histidine kinase/response regulator n=1 Tax=uncultured Variovorax sp. TaxID=114708 RepID=UPI0025F74FFF|nr:PAS domain S-box protein [uncultured Variovorax sp.]